MNDYERKIKLLDDILSALIESENHSLNESKLNQKSYAKHLNKGPNFKYEFIGIVDSADEFRNAVEYLIEQGMIKPIEGEYRITYRGILHLSKGGYIEEYNESRKMIQWNRWFWQLTPIISTLALLLTIIQWICNSPS